MRPGPFLTTPPPGVVRYALPVHSRGLRGHGANHGPGRGGGGGTLPGAPQRIQSGVLKYTAPGPCLTTLHSSPGGEGSGVSPQGPRGMAVPSASREDLCSIPTSEKTVCSSFIFRRKKMGQAPTGRRAGRNHRKNYDGQNI